MDVTNTEQSSSALSKDKTTVDSTGKLQIMNNRLTLLEINAEHDIIETINSYRTSILVYLQSWLSLKLIVAMVCIKEVRKRE